MSYGHTDTQVAPGLGGSPNGLTIVFRRPCQRGKSIDPTTTMDEATAQPLVPPSPAEPHIYPTIALPSTPTEQVKSPPLRASSRSNLGINSKLQLLHHQEIDFRVKGSALISATITRKIAALKLAAQGGSEFLISPSQ